MSDRPERYKENGSDRDFIDEFQSTKTPDEVRGAMLFSMGKYQRRYGKKDDHLAEAIKIADYANRLVEYERSLVATDAPEFDEERTDIVASSHGDGEHYAVDMRYAENWNAGDWLLLVDADGYLGIESGSFHRLQESGYSASGIMVSVDGFDRRISARRFRFHARPDADGWIKWEGGECPVGVDIDVDIRTAEGEGESSKAGDFVWEHDNAPYDIIAYRPNLATKQDKG